METNHKFEAFEDRESNKNSYNDIRIFEGKSNEVKLFSRHRNSTSSSSSIYSLDLTNVVENNNNAIDDDTKPFEISEVKPSASLPENHMPTTGQFPAGYNPYRIPSSVFSDRPATPMEWSITSNESLFSLHVGNYSFTKDQFGTLFKSGELTKLDEQIIAHGDNLPSLKELENMASKDENVNDALATSVISKKMGVESTEVAEDLSNQDMPSTKGITNSPTLDFGANLEKKSQADVHISPCNSISKYSDESNHSTFSFAFPMLVGTDAVRFSSAKGDQYIKALQTQSKRQQQQEVQKGQLESQTPVAPRNASKCRWLSWFRCCRCS